MTEHATERLQILEPDEQALARLIKRAAGRSWCSTSPATIARYLLAAGVQLPANQPEEVHR